VVGKITVVLMKSYMNIFMKKGDYRPIFIKVECILLNLNFVQGSDSDPHWLYEDPDPDSGKI
jgi:hypothetical protein